MSKFFKTIAVLAVALFSTTFSANAKIPFFMYGVSAGANVSNIKISSDVGSDLKESNQYGYQAGAMVGLDLPLLEITAEALWVHNQMTATLNDKTGDIKSNTIEFPIMASLPILGPIRLKAGPSFNIPVNAKIDYGSGNEDDLGAIKSSLGYAVGLGLNIFKLTFDVRYNGQFGDQTAIMGIESTGTEYDIKANSFSASIGYRF